MILHLFLAWLDINALIFCLLVIWQPGARRL